MKTIVKLLALGILFLSSNALLAQEDPKKPIIEEYEKLAASLDSMEGQGKKDSDYFLKLALPYYQIAQSDKGFDGLKLPTHVYNTKPDFFDSPKGKEEWLNWSNDLLIDLRLGACNFKDYLGTPLPVSLIDQQRHARLIAQLDAYVLAKNGQFDPLLAAIDSYNSNKSSSNAGEKEEVVGELLQLYDNKYKGGYRNRNILEYFLDGGLHAWEQKRKKKEKGLLTPPSRKELIFLANPILGIGSPSFKKFSDDPNSVYLIVQLIGMDFHNEDFTKFSGVSLFHASPVNTSLQFFTRPLLGVEMHYGQFNLGCGVEYPKFKVGNPDNYAFKVFISFAAFDVVYKKRKGKT